MNGTMFLDNIPRSHDHTRFRAKSYLGVIMAQWTRSAKKLEDIVGLHCYEIWQQSNESCEGCPILENNENR